MHMSAHPPVEYISKSVRPLEHMLTCYATNILLAGHGATLSFCDVGRMRGDLDISDRSPLPFYDNPSASISRPGVAIPDLAATPAHRLYQGGTYTLLANFLRRSAPNQRNNNERLEGSCGLQNASLVVLSEGFHLTGADRA